MKKYKYLRISSKTQNPSRQIDDNYELFMDICSGLVPFIDREKGAELLKTLEAGDTLIIESICRLGRHKMDMLYVLDELKKKQINVRVENLGIESILPNGKYNSVFDIITTLLSSISAYEKEQIAERTRQGIEIGKLEGKYKGRKKGSILNRTEFLERNKKSVQIISKHPNLSLRELSKLTGVSYGKVRKIKQLI